MLVKVFYNLFLKWYRELIIHFFFPIREWSYCSLFLSYIPMDLAFCFVFFVYESMFFSWIFFCDDNDDKPEWSECCSTSSSIYKHDLLFTTNFFFVLFLNAILCFLLLTLSCFSCVHLHSDNSFEKFEINI